MCTCMLYICGYVCQFIVTLFHPKYERSKTAQNGGTRSDQELVGGVPLDIYIYTYIYIYIYSPNSACTTEGFLLELNSNSPGNQDCWSPP